MTWLFHHLSQSHLADVAGHYFSQHFENHFLAIHKYSHNTPIEDLSAPTESPPELLTPESLNEDDEAVIWEVEINNKLPQ